MVCIVACQASLVHSYWAWFKLFRFMLPWFSISVLGLYCFISCLTGSSLQGMVCIFWLRASLVHHYWVRFVLFDIMHHWFTIAWHGLYFVLHDSVVHSYWAWFVLFNHPLVHPYCALFVLFHFMLHCLFLTGHGLYCFPSFFPGSSLLGMFCIIVSLLPLLVHLYWAWAVLFHFLLS